MADETSREVREEPATASGDEIAALEILGAFLSVFGIALLLAVFFTGGSRAAFAIGALEVTTAQLTNLACGLLILGIGAAFFLRGRAIRRRRAATTRVPAPDEGRRPC